jgi:hypothetical protein
MLSDGTPKQINHLLSFLLTYHSIVVTIKEKDWMAHTLVINSQFVKIHKHFSQKVLGDTGFR